MSRLDQHSRRNTATVLLCGRKGEEEARDWWRHAPCTAPWTAAAPSSLAAAPSVFNPNPQNESAPRRRLGLRELGCSFFCSFSAHGLWARSVRFFQPMGHEWIIGLYIFRSSQCKILAHYEEWLGSVLDHNTMVGQTPVAPPLNVW
jgi:hypothetical protein